MSEPYHCPSFEGTRFADSLPPWNFVGHTAVVSAGAHGIGRGIVRRLAMAGANVVFGDIDLPGGRKLEAMLSGASGRVKFGEADFGDPEAWSGLLAECSREGWNPSIGIANAGVGLHSPIGKISLGDYARVESINQRSAFLMAKALAPGMGAAGGGSLLFIGSIMSDFGTSDYALYGMTKSALGGLARSLAVELAKECIRTNCIQPGFILGEIPAEIMPEVPRALRASCAERFGSRFEREFSKLQPLPVGAVAEDVAQLVCFLSSPAARFITGGSFRVDGGLSVEFPFTRDRLLLSESLVSEVRQWVRIQSERVGGGSSPGPVQSRTGKMEPEGS